MERHPMLMDQKTICEGDNTSQNDLQRQYNLYENHTCLFLQRLTNILSHQRSANQNHNEIPPHTSQNGCYQKDERLVSVSKDVKKRELLHAVDGNEIGVATMGNSMKGSQKIKASLVAQLVKNPPAMWDTWAQSLGWEDPLEKGKATHSSILAWRIPRTVQPIESQRVGHN